MAPWQVFANRTTPLLHLRFNLLLWRGIRQLDPYRVFQLFTALYLAAIADTRYGNTILCTFSRNKSGKISGGLPLFLEPSSLTVPGPWNPREKAKGRQDHAQHREPFGRFIRSTPEGLSKNCQRENQDGCSDSGFAFRWIWDLFGYPVERGKDGLVAG
ncbi:hypothetical protein BDQ17DRAFT_1331309 [Cyathus striatus]|nr:hypothetical protein BDQ17DRAFT_1331309 [Cyathus striatus]